MKDSNENLKMEQRDTHMEYPLGQGVFIPPRLNAQRQHECLLWQYLIQRIISQVNQGYVYYACFNIPDIKMPDIERIDTKIILKYNTYISKDQRYRFKSKGMANFQYFRFHAFGIVLATTGTIAVKDCEKFQSINTKPILIKVESIELQIRKMKGVDKKSRFTVSLSDKCMLGFKSYFKDLARRKQPETIISKYDNLNGIPCYTGIIANKSKLIRYIDYLSRIHKGL